MAPHRTDDGRAGTGLSAERSSSGRCGAVTNSLAASDPRRAAVRAFRYQEQQQNDRENQRRAGRRGNPRESPRIGLAHGDRPGAGARSRACFWRNPTRPPWLRRVSAASQPDRQTKTRGRPSSLDVAAGGPVRRRSGYVPQDSHALARHAVLHTNVAGVWDSLIAFPPRAVAARAVLREYQEEPAPKSRCALAENRVRAVERTFGVSAGRRATPRAGAGSCARSGPRKPGG
jgi:hypothetical protein